MIKSRPLDLAYSAASNATIPQSTDINKSALANNA